MESCNMKVQRVPFLLLLLLLCCLTRAKQTVPECCRQKSCSCRIFELLRGMGNHAAGILTLGKRGSATANQAFYSQLYHLFHSRGNQAAGILTMGKRAVGELVKEPTENSIFHSYIPLAPAPCTPGPCPPGSCLASLEKDLPPDPKTIAVDTTY